MQRNQIFALAPARFSLSRMRYAAFTPLLDPHVILDRGHAFGVTRDLHRMVHGCI
jgi:hypothetical protein